MPPPPVSVPGMVTPPPRTKRSPSVTLVAIVVAILVISAAILASARLLGGSKKAMLPDSVGAFQTISSANVQQAIDAFHNQASQNGLEADLAVYGSGSTPRILLAWIRDATVTDPDTALTAFASGFAQGFGGSIAMDQKQTQTIEGVAFVCAPITGSTQAAICLWRQREVFYILFDPESGGNLDATLGLSVTAHRAVG